MTNFEKILLYNKRGSLCVLSELIDMIDNPEGERKSMQTKLSETKWLIWIVLGQILKCTICVNPPQDLIQFGTDTRLKGALTQPRIFAWPDYTIDSLRQIQAKVRDPTLQPKTKLLNY